LVEWTKQLATGMNYLHQHKIIHRDLKSPNILIGKNEIIKISDFGTSQQWSEHSTKMSFAGTVAWMAPEIIRNEPCNEKVDIWSFGVCVWELLTCEVPYKNVDSSAIIWGVGSNALQLPLASSCPEGFKLLIKQCWSSKPRNRPSFKHILMHLDIAAVEILSYKPEDYFRTQQSWKVEVMEYNEKMKCEENSIPVQDEAMIKKRQEELQHAQDVRELYEKKLERTTNLYLELNATMLRIEQRELEIQRREERVKTSERVMNISRKKSRPVVRLPRRSEMSQSTLSTSPDSPTHIGAAAVKGPALERTDQHLPTVHRADQYHPTVEKLQQKKTRHRRSGSGSLSLTPRSSPKQEERSCHQGREVSTQTDQLEEETDRSDYFSMSRQTSGRRSDKSFSSFNTSSSQCCCPGCPANLSKDSFMDATEDHLDDLDKKVSEMMIRDGSRRSSHHDLARKMTKADLVGFDGDKESSEEMMESSQEEDCSQMWSEDEDQFVLKRGSLSRMPIRGKNRSSAMSLRSFSLVSVASSEEGEVSEYPHSKRSTLESNPGVRLGDSD